MNAKNIMLDLETYDTAPTAIVLSIGAVRFDAHNCYERIYVSCGTAEHRNDQLNHFRTQSADTVAWWEQQTPEARKVLYDTEAVTPREALDRFRTFCGEGAIIWGNGADFDNVILRSMYASYSGDDKSAPWRYYNNRCFRTLKSLSPVKVDRIGTYHNALDDAVHQALHAQAILQALRVQL